MPRILVIDDHADSREGLARYLRNAGHEVECAIDGQDALQRIIPRTPDLIVLDIGMPGMDGARFLEMLRSYQNLKSLPVVVWTALSDSWLVSRMRSMKVAAVITKGNAGFDQVLHAIDGAILPTA
jgi:CheY-like chemotaxis protein